MVAALLPNGAGPSSRLKRLADALAFSVAMRIAGPFPASYGLPTSYVTNCHDIEIGIFTPERLNAVVLPLLAEPQPCRPSSLDSVHRHAR